MKIKTLLWSLVSMIAATTIVSAYSYSGTGYKHTARDGKVVVDIKNGPTLFDGYRLYIDHSLIFLDGHVIPIDLPHEDIEYYILEIDQALRNEGTYCYHYNIKTKNGKSYEKADCVGKYNSLLEFLEAEFLPKKDEL